MSDWRRQKEQHDRAWVTYDNYLKVLEQNLSPGEDTDKQNIVAFNAAEPNANDTITSWYKKLYKLYRFLPDTWRARLPHHVLTELRRWDPRQVARQPVYEISAQLDAIIDSEPFQSRSDNKKDRQPKAGTTEKSTTYNADTDKPLILKQAQVSPHWPEFKKAMQQEYDSLIENNTWELVPTPNQAVLTGRLVFKIKKDCMGNILKFKARWIAHGYKQKEGLNFTNTFASVAKPMSWKVMIGVSAKCGYKIWQMDIVIAYLFGFLDETVYIYQPTLMDDGTGRDCMLKKALYGLKQSARVWYQTLQDFLKKLGFKRIEADHGFFVSNNKSIFIAVYVDDILFFGDPNDKQIHEVLHYLGMEVDNNVEKKIITLCQSTCLKKIVSHYGLKGCRPAKIPMSPGVPNSLDPNTSQATKDTITWY
ncbi:Reverse transcriptase, RNA-dependent DNA polymerase [Lasallia pustulata]|uniref:Reverse transcriptase, RNA-dependent DNA polymerase n=1 Tax=Lasallia pustulata TaxID=136370 RepID=A0A1W5CUX1_9LECA|nr:Reverse transcriptase, RNA-dependent DNA polymerase [Lasallia pustulata]